MPSIWKSRGKKLHSRKIEVTTYNYDGQRIIVEGLLKDDRFQKAYTITGQTHPAGVIHHMAIRLLINCSNLTIEDVDVDLISMPEEVCRETRDSLTSIKGLAVTKGFTLKVKKLVGGIKGCTHLVELLQAMAPAIFQGYVAYREQKPAAFDPDQVKRVLQSLANTCHGWHEDGPYVEMFKKKLNMK